MWTMMASFIFLARQWNPATKEILPYPIAVTICFLIFLPLWRRQSRKFQRELDVLNEFEKEESM